MERRHQIIAAAQAGAESVPHQQAALAALDRHRGDAGRLAIHARRGAWDVTLFEIRQSISPHGPICHIRYPGDGATATCRLAELLF